uniref:Isocitrate dehydrogenase [NADP] n=1 Tax=Biomphalaria glabrata TaxID=6526 RepID=A0A2C9K6Y6_BIOGL
MKYADIDITIESVEAGEKAYAKHWINGIAEYSWESLLKSKAILKGPIYTPSDGYRSVNVSIRRKLELYANVRPVMSYEPFVNCVVGDVDLVIIRENEEGAYTGVEYRRSKNIAEKYPKIQKEKHIVDIGMARLAARPNKFDVVVTTNLYGDIASDIAAEMTGSIGLAGSANIGDNYSMFEAVHGTAPDIAGKGIANPSGLLNAAIMMLNHLGFVDKASIIKNAFLKTIESGIHTFDIESNRTTKVVGTKDFTEAVIENLGMRPSILKESIFYKNKKISSFIHDQDNMLPKFNTRGVVCMDVCIAIDSKVDFEFEPNSIAENITKILENNLALGVIFCKGLKIWPNAPRYSNIKDSCTLRIINIKVGSTVEYIHAMSCINKITEIGLIVTSIDFLFEFDDKPGFSFSDN